MNGQITIAIDDRKIKKLIKGAKVVISSIKKDIKKLKRMGFEVDIKIKTNDAVDKIINDSIIIK